MRDFPELVTAATDPVWDDRQKVPAKLETSEAGTQTEGPPGPGVGEEERGTGVPAVSSEGGWLSCQLSSRREGIAGTAYRDTGAESNSRQSVNRVSRGGDVVRSGYDGNRGGPR